MSFFPETPEKIKQRLRSYTNALKKEKKLHGFYDDGYGKRYLIGPLHLLLSDYEGGMAYYNWFEKEFPNDVNEPFNYLCWTLTLYKNKHFKEAENKLIQTILCNFYLVPYLLNLEIETIDVRPFSNYNASDYVFNLPDELKELWDDDSLEWLSRLWSDEKIQSIKNEYIVLLRELAKEDKYEKRGNMLKHIAEFKAKFK